jgi:antitoxin component YwqK of YwqJK toxin-antitoxin module
VGNDDILFQNSQDNFVNTTNPAVCIYHLKTKKYQILSNDKNNQDFRVADDRIFYVNDEGVQSFILKNGQFKKEKVLHQLKDPGLIYTPNNHLILEKVNDKDGKSVSTTFEIIDLTQVK